ncbi:MAG: hypothetical protein QM650_18495 [Microlunatus sp.]
MQKPVSLDQDAFVAAVCHDIRCAVYAAKNPGERAAALLAFNQAAQDAVVVITHRDPASPDPGDSESSSSGRILAAAIAHQAQFPRS